jgi:hypothetical protein
MKASEVLTGTGDRTRDQNEKALNELRGTITANWPSSNAAFSSHFGFRTWARDMYLAHVLSLNLFFSLSLSLSSLLSLSLSLKTQRTTGAI